MSQSFSDNINSFKATTAEVVVHVSDKTIADDRSNILAWLSPLDPGLRHQDVRERRVGDVGEWLLRTEEFRSWCAGGVRDESENAVLFCYGNLGVGKTFISSLVIDSLCDRAEGQDVTVACFYFDFAAREEQSPKNMLGALLKQVVSGLEVVPEEIVQAYKDQKKVTGGRGPLLTDIVKMLQTTSSRKRTFICIDALDECAAGHRVKILDSLNQILQNSPATRIFVTGRPDIQPEIGKRLSGRITTISITPRRDDIISYLHTRLSMDTALDAMDSSLEADILQKIPDDISEIFLLVSLSMDAILQETTIHRRRQKLNAMTDGLGLGDAYGATLGRIKGQGGGKAGLGMATLMLISHAERPLKPDELCHALAVEIGSANFDAENTPSIGALMAYCQGLVVVDKEVSTVRLIHSTLQEYLQTHPELFGAAHATMAEICLTYLNSQQVKAISTRLSPSPQSTPFLEYSSLYWGIHAKKDLSNCAKLLALKLFDDDDYNNHISIKILLKSQGSCIRIFCFDKPSQFSGLHCACMFGIVEIVAELLEVECCDINQRDYMGKTPLWFAARYGHEGVVEILLGRYDANPDIPDNDGITPLLCAAMNGHEGVVKILLERGDVNPNQLDRDDRTPLCSAARNGHEEVVKILLERGDVDPNRPDMDDRTPLCSAAWNGHEGVVKILLRRNDVNPNQPDEGGRTPLWWAARIGHGGAAKILLGRNDVNPNQPDEDGRTPLWWAARNGSQGVIKALLGRDDISADEPDDNGRTPLCCGVLNGHEVVVEILLGRDDVNPDRPDEDGQTPLCCASRSGHEMVVKILLGRNSVSPDRPDVDGRTPLWWAARNGYEGVVKALLGRDDINPDKPDEDGRTPLYCAALGGHERVVKILLERDGVNPVKLDNNGVAPLWMATKHGRAGVVSLLMSQGLPLPAQSHAGQI